jgi:cell division septal protein FtsQ
LQTRVKRFIRTILVAAVIALLAYGLGWSKIIAVDSIVISGTEESKLVNSQLVAGESKIKKGEPLARINPRTEANLLEDLEWISAAKITRNWWSGEVQITIIERTPVAVFKDITRSGEPRYLASDGFEFSSPKKFNDLAEISLSEKSPGERRLIANFVSQLSPELVGSLLGLEISAGNEVKMQISHGKKSISVNWGSGNSAADIAVKSKVLMGLLALPENKKIAEVDLTIANSPIVS